MVDASKYDFIKAPDKTNFVDGKRYGVMFEIANYAMIYNTDLVKTPPKTFDEFLAAAKAVDHETVSSGTGCARRCPRKPACGKTS